MRVFPIHDEPLPDDYARAVGLVIARWARQEGLLIEVLRTILKIGPKEARHVVGTGQGIDYVPLIRTLIEVQGLTTRVDLSDLRGKIQNLREKRNTLAHGLWMRDEAGVLCLQDTTGKWTPNPEQPEVTRKRKPEGSCSCCSFVMSGPLRIDALPAPADRHPTKAIAMPRAGRSPR
jgi:hypothetical protein